MDLIVFIRSLSEAERKELFLLLKKEFKPAQVETLAEFMERSLEGTQISVRLRTCFGRALSQHKQFPERNKQMEKAITDVTHDDLYILKGVGEMMWEEFVSLRGY